MLHVARDRITKLTLPIGGQSQCRAPRQCDAELRLGHSGKPNPHSKRHRKSVVEDDDPTLGIMHEGRDGSAAFVFDMMEPERPKVDRCILEFVQSHKFHAADFVIRSDGVCRLNPAMARCVAQVVCGVLV